MVLVVSKKVKLMQGVTRLQHLLAELLEKLKEIAMFVVPSPGSLCLAK